MPIEHVQRSSLVHNIAPLNNVHPGHIGACFYVNSPWPTSSSNNIHSETYMRTILGLVAAPLPRMKFGHRWLDFSEKG
jgi:hypothetical protein